MLAFLDTQTKHNFDGSTHIPILVRSKEMW